VEVLAVRSAAEMASAVESRFEAATIALMAAAVSDYRPAEVSPVKLKKGQGGVSLELVRTPDILGGLAPRKGARTLVGFAAETDHLLENARQKLKSKALDVIVANDVTREGAGFEGETNAAVLLDREGRESEIALTSKRELADRILDRVLELRTGKREPAVAR
jgi:phosphopantothenoylcysteine decarboxylase / phosphopantothenate---cysteine ligase